MGAWLKDLKIRWGFGIGENTALVIDGDKFTVKGEKGVFIFDF